MKKSFITQVGVMILLLIMSVSVFAEETKEEKVLGRKFIKMNPDAEELDMDDKFLIAPAYMWGMGGLKNEMMASGVMTAAVMGLFKENAISLEPLSAPLKVSGMDWMFGRMIYAARHMITWHDAWDPAQDAGYHGGATELQALLDGMGTLINLIAEKIPQAEGVRYIILVEVGATGHRIPVFWQLKNKAVVYDLEKGVFVKYVELAQVIPAKYEAVAPATAGIAKKLHTALFPKKKKK